jgi:hypothetical protein
LLTRLLPTTTARRALGVSTAVVGVSGAYIWVHPEVIGMDPETNGWDGGQEAVQLVAYIDATRHALTLKHNPHRWELSQAVLRGMRLGKTVALIVADYKLQDTPFWGDGLLSKDTRRLSKEAEAALAAVEKGECCGL